MDREEGCAMLYRWTKNWVRYNQALHNDLQPTISVLFSGDVKRIKRVRTISEWLGTRRAFTISQKTK